MPSDSPSYDSLTIAGQTYPKAALLAMSGPFPPWREEFQQVIRDWLSDATFMEVQTSGSTGKPKTIQIAKEYMINHARMTGEFFDLKAGDKALVCLPAGYIAGKMILIRGFVLGLDLMFVEPTSRPLEGMGAQDFDFAAMIPLQVEQSLEHDRKAFERIKTVIIGGAPVSYQLREKLKNCPNRLFATYGMTETITHVAVQDLKLKDYYEALPGISLAQDERDCLVIDAPQITLEKVVTNDLVELENNRFKWLGRYDNIINSGGVKVIPEEVERALAPFISQRFFVVGTPHKQLGEIVTLVVEGDLVDLAMLQEQTNLPKHHFPRKVIQVPAFVETASGKIQREKTLGPI